MPKPARRRWFATLGVAVAILAIIVASPGCSVGYLAQQGWFQAELLAGRMPIEEAIEEGFFSEDEVAKLRLVPRIKEYGRQIGLASTDNYDTINPTWDRTIWNVSACHPTRFEPKTWWFPIVGRVPYLGYFRDQDAQRKADRLREQGYDVYARTAGAYSTLGWFRDPLLPGMLKWSEPSLADTILHELAHATLWVPGSVDFNESFANFVGQQASLGYLVATYGPDSAILQEERERREDRDAFSRMLEGVYQDLDALYRGGGSEAEKLAGKKAILDSLPGRTVALGLHREQAYLDMVRTSEWNNARLVQFKVYNRSPEQFAHLLAEEDGDIARFIARIGDITAGERDPYVALSEAVGDKAP
jgi:predicted aminopeptidase